MGFLMLGWAVMQHPVLAVMQHPVLAVMQHPVLAVMQHPVLALVPLLLVVWSLAIIETQNEEYEVV